MRSNGGNGKRGDSKWAAHTGCFPQPEVTGPLPAILPSYFLVNNPSLFRPGSSQTTIFTNSGFLFHFFVVFLLSAHISINSPFDILSFHYIHLNGLFAFCCHHKWYRQWGGRQRATKCCQYPESTVIGQCHLVSSMGNKNSLPGILKWLWAIDFQHLMLKRNYILTCYH